MQVSISYYLSEVILRFLLAWVLSLKFLCGLESWNFQTLIFLVDNHTNKRMLCPERELSDPIDFGGTRVFSIEKNFLAWITSLSLSPSLPPFLVPSLMGFMWINILLESKVLIVCWRSQKPQQLGSFRIPNYPVTCQNLGTLFGGTRVFSIGKNFLAWIASLSLSLPSLPLFCYHHFWVVCELIFC